MKSTIRVIIEKVYGLVRARLVDTDGDSVGTATNPIYTTGTGSGGTTPVSGDVNVLDPCKGTQTNNIDVDVQSSALPAGAATAANQGTANTHLSNIRTDTQSIDGKITACNTGAIAGTVTANAGTNLNTSALALESGGVLDSIDGKITACDTGAIAGTVTANAGTNLNTSALALESGGVLDSIDSKLTASAPSADGVAGSSSSLFTVGFNFGFNGSTWDRVRVDPTTHNWIVDDGSHVAIHQEKSFHYSFEHAIGAGTYYVAIITPNTTAWDHFTWSAAVDGGSIKVTLFENPTSSIGSVVTPVNRNRNSAAVAATAVVLNRTVTVDGTALEVTRIGVSRPSGGGESRATQEWLLNQNEEYILKIEGSTTGVSYTMHLDWYERTNV